MVFCAVLGAILVQELEKREAFAKLLHEHLAVADRSASWLASRIGVSASTVTRWLNAETIPSTVAMVEKIVKAFGLSHEERRALYQATGYMFAEASQEVAAQDDAPAGDGVVDDAIATVWQAAAVGSIDVVEPEDHRQDQIDHITKALQPSHTLPKWMAAIVRYWYWVVVVVAAGGLVAWWATAQIFPLSRTFAFDKWDYKVVGESSLNDALYKPLLTDQTRRAMYQKLSAIEGLQALAQSAALEVEASNPPSDILLHGFSIVEGNLIKLEVDIYVHGKSIGTVSHSITPAADFQENAEQVLNAVHEQVVINILRMLDIPVGPETLDRIARYPTRSMEALRLNNDAVQMVLDDDLVNGQAGFEKAIALDPSYADAHNNLGRVFYLQGRLDEAVAEYKLAIDQQPRNTIYLANIAIVYAELGQFDLASVNYENALRYEPVDTKLLNNYSYVLLLAGDFVKAKQMAEQGLRIEPDSPYLHKNLGRVYLETEAYEAAIEQLKLATELNGEDRVVSEALYFLSLANYAAGRVDAACNTVSEYAAIATEEDMARFRTADVLNQEFNCP